MKFDLRYLQILFLSGFLTYGIVVLDWDIRLEQVAGVIISALLTQSLFCLAYNIPINAVKSALISSLGLSIILRSNYLFVFILAGFFAIGSKFLLRYDKKHFVNPANFGVVFIILFTGVAWISPAQWGHSETIFFIVTSLALIILTNLKKIDLALSFIIFYFGMDLLWNVGYKGWPLDYTLHNLSNGAIVLFSFFMITDPSSTPNSRLARILWVFLIAILAFYLGTFHFIKGAPIYALFFMSPFVPLLDKIMKESVFSWDSMERRTLYTNSI
jgi:Na+-transporting NADH:ubiquinone oxidoreductase subunit NqrB